MKILAIETSCDETAIAIVEAHGKIGNASFKVLGNAIHSQIKLHEKYGGVFPMLAKREHGKNLVPILHAALLEARMFHKKKNPLDIPTKKEISKLLERETGLEKLLINLTESMEKPSIDVIAVTSYGSGLEPALWAGINFAKALARLWKLPVVPVNHMEGHLFSGLISKEKIDKVRLPLLGLLISGGQTELVLMRKWLSYEIVGETQDDAAGEAFDKVARMLGPPYPGGPHISKLAEDARAKKIVPKYKLPRPMLKTKDCNFSFAGLKTAVLYTLKKIPKVTPEVKKHIALEFENAVGDVLTAKTKRAIDSCKPGTLALGGGVSANLHIRKSFGTMLRQNYPDVKLFMPSKELTGDNAVMIALAGYFRALQYKTLKNIPHYKTITAQANKRF